ncbi:MAG: hypothetical protein HOQ00_05695 [Agromyces sp.]|nr:hypothetical protein [Agromyces sp.]
MTEASVPADAGAAASADDAAAPQSATPLWLAVTIAVLFGVLYAYDVWEAVGNLVGLNVQAGSLGIALSGLGLTLLIVALVLPFLVFGVAFWLGYRRGPLQQVVLFLAGYAAVQALTFGLTDLFFQVGGLDLG